MIAGIVALIHLRRSPEARAKVRDWIDERDDRRGWSILARISRPVWHFFLKPAAVVADFGARFTQARVTPGNLGLELTTLLALAAVGTFRSSSSATRARDRRAGDRPLRVRPRRPPAHGRLVSAAKVLTDIGSSRVTAASRGHDALRGTAGARSRRRARRRLAARLRRRALHQDRVRPRAPAGSLVETFNPPIPSGHSAYAVTLIACATVLVRAGVGWAVRIAAVTVAVVLVAVVGVTRVYLRAHYLTDVLGGIALALAIWSLLGVSPCSPDAFVTMLAASDRRPEDLRDRRSGRRDLADRLAVRWSSCPHGSPTGGCATGLWRRCSASTCSAPSSWPGPASGGGCALVFLDRL